MAAFFRLQPSNFGPMEMLADWWFNSSQFYRAVFIITLAALLVQLLLDLVFVVRIVLWKGHPAVDTHVPVSVVVCVRNEEKHLRELIPALFDQDHPDFEVVVVDDSSWDETAEILRAFQAMYQRLHVVRLDEDKQRMTGKKFALTVGIKGARNPIVVLTDADCMPQSRQWLSSMSAPFANPETEVVIGVSPYRKTKGLLNWLIRYDAAEIAVSYISMALAKLPYMGVGRNLAYRKDLFFRNSGFKSHLHLASGDDDLFISEVATAKNTAVVIHPQNQTLSHPKTTWKAWTHQKRRHFTTAPHYKLGIKLLLGIRPASFLILWVGALLLALVHNAFLIAGIALGLRYVVHLTTFIAAFRKIGQKDLSPAVPVWEAFITLINPALWIWNLLAAPRTWK